eukprot:3166219-Rhodomonas_salina.3
MTEASKHQEALDKISAETEQLKEMSSQLPTELQALQKQLSEEKENHEKELQGATHVLPIDTSLFADCFLLAVAALSHSDRTRAQKQSSLESGHELYQKRLALKFERFQDGLVIKMHNIDPEAPQRQFSFSIRVEDDTNTYTVRECTPMVDDLEELVSQVAFLFSCYALPGPHIALDATFCDAMSDILNSMDAASLFLPRMRSSILSSRMLLPAQRHQLPLQLRARRPQGLVCSYAMRLRVAQ